MTNYDTILSSMEMGKPVRVVHNGHERFMCAHTLGTTNGYQQALFYQYAGETSNGPITSPEWRCLKLYDISSIEIIGDPWHTGRNHSRPQTCVKQVAAQIFVGNDGKPSLVAV